MSTAESDTAPGSLPAAPALELLETRLLSDDWYRLHRYTYRLRRRDGQWARQRREVYDRGDGACVLLYDGARRTLLLTRQFRMPTYVNGNASGMLLEACAGALDGEDPQACILREAREETGCAIGAARKVFEAYMSPGAVTERLHFFVAPYTPAQRALPGGGVDDEDIEVVELEVDAAFAMLARGEIQDAKTIMLLQYAQLHLFSST